VDITLDLMIHDIDIVTGFVQSAVKSISATGDRVLTGKIDAAKHGWSSRTAARPSLRPAAWQQKRLGAEGPSTGHVYICRYQTQEVRKYYKGAGGIAFDVIRPESREPLKEELKDFISVCWAGHAEGSGREATQALEIVLQINEMLKQ